MKKRVKTKDAASSAFDSRMIAVARAVQLRNLDDLCFGVTWSTRLGWFSCFTPDWIVFSPSISEMRSSDERAVKASRTRTTDAAGAGFAAEGPLSAENQDWRNVIIQFRDQLQQICESELVCSDKEAQRIIIGMVHCQNMMEVDAQMDRLVIRIGELLVVKTGDASELTRLVSQSRERGRAALARHSKQHKFSADDQAGRLTRTVVKL